MLCFVLVKIFIIFGFILKQCKRLECSFFLKKGVNIHMVPSFFIFYVFELCFQKKTHLIKVK